MRLILGLLTVLSLTIYGCGKKDSTDTSSSNPSEETQQAQEQTEPAVCNDSPLLSCQQLLDLYVLSYTTLPEEPTGRVMVWALRLSAFQRITLGNTLTESDLTESEDLIVRGNGLLKQELEDCPTAESDPAQCLEDPTQYEPLVESLEDLRTSLITGHYLLFLDRYVPWARRINASSSTIQIDPNNPEPLWFNWINQERYVDNASDFRAFAKEKAHCDSDDMYSMKLTEDQENPYVMHAILKERICSDEALALEEMEMVQANFPVANIQNQGDE